MYAVEVRDRIMIAHSLPDPFFGPAQHMHGATFVVDVAFYREQLTKQNVVVDIGAALDVLGKTLKPLAYKNLVELAQFKGKLTTTEFLCRYVFDAVAKAAKDGALGEDGKGLSKIRVTLHETDLARAWFEGPVRQCPCPPPRLCPSRGGWNATDLARSSLRARRMSTSELSTKAFLVGVSLWHCRRSPHPMRPTVWPGPRS
jgi:6-pyruvoyl-tetrahydropterin synthase